MRTAIIIIVALAIVVGGASAISLLFPESSLLIKLPVSVLWGALVGHIAARIWLR